ncbi:MAG: PHP domain-containing protein [Lachnospiraceae bacterium]
MKYIDLHVHSTASDGTCTPSELVQLAKEQGLYAFALTDHDTVSGIDEAIHAAKKTDIKVIPGIEMSAVYNGQDIHILGYKIAYKDEIFLKKIHEYQSARTSRNEKMITLLHDYGFDIDTEKLYAMFPDAVLTRAHFARYLLEKRYVKSAKEAFEKYIGSGCPCYLPKKEITMKEALTCILQAKGYPVFAHPMLYHMDEKALDELLSKLVPLGLKGIEAIYSTNNSYDELVTRKLAKKYNLFITGGSDFHGTNKPYIQLGIGKGNLKIPYELLENIK